MKTMEMDKAFYVHAFGGLVLLFLSGVEDDASAALVEGYAALTDLAEPPPAVVDWLYGGA